jgi:uncharacterized protein YbaR (Trm112 family)
VTRSDFVDPRPRVRRFLKWVSHRTHRRRRVDLLGMLACTDCGGRPLKGDLSQTELECLSCGRHFAVIKGVPYMHPAGWTSP